ncbi:MAG: ATP-binding protein [Gemmataceae bacterium]
MKPKATNQADIAVRGELVFAEHVGSIRRHTDRLFIFIMLLQWVAGVAVAVFVSPRAWSGTYSETHFHVWAATLMGGVITLLPVALAVRAPGTRITRYVISVAQMMWSALLIHLSGGRIETHFHVFASLALLAWYRDTSVLVLATLVVAIDHYVRGVFLPQSVYGVLTSSPWRTFEHAGWVLTENVFLWFSIQRNLKMMLELAMSHAAMGVDRDLTQEEYHKQSQELQGTEERLRQAQKMEGIGRLAGGIAHDFNNLLTIIGGYSELLLSSGDASTLQYEHVTEIKKAADRATSLTRQLLAFSRKQILAPRLIDLNATVRDIEKMLSRLIGEDIELNTLLSPGIGRIKVDPGQLEQVIINLAVNSRDAMPNGGTLTIETKNIDLEVSEILRQESQVLGTPTTETTSFVLLTISDTGCGMDEETKAHLFEPFFTTKEVGQGTGLGLATVYGIVKQSGGAVSVYSEVGQGTIFKIYLPRVEDMAAPSSNIAPRPAVTAGAETILLVEDEGKVRELTRTVLKTNGYRVLEARNGLDAIEVAEKFGGTIHLLLTDLVMPKLGGRHLAERLRPTRPNMAVLFMSGYTDDHVIRHGIIDSDMAFLQKPFSPQMLLRKIRDVMNFESALATADA